MPGWWEVAEWRRKDFKGYCQLLALRFKRQHTPYIPLLIIIPSLSKLYIPSDVTKMTPGTTLLPCRVWQPEQLWRRSRETG